MRIANNRAGGRPFKRTPFRKKGEKMQRVEDKRQLLHQ
jgi:hypothetical protein